MTVDVRAEPLHRGGLARDTLVVTVCTLLSRVTGFVRVLVAAAVLGNGLLGDTYHAANTVPNLLFELVAGGVLQAFLVPTFVAAVREGGDEALGRAVGVVAGVVMAALAAVAAVVMALTPLIVRVLTGAGDADVLADKRAVMLPMLLVFVPQIVFYGIGMVTTAALAAQGRFAAAALAPAVNSVIVITCYLLYRSSRAGEEATLDLDATQFWLLAGGTTLAVVAFTAVPGIVLRLHGVRWRPRWRPGDALIAQLRRSIGWAGLSVVGTLLPTAAAVILGYRAEGGVAVFTMTFAFFVLPHALVAVPVATTTAPRVADAWQRGDRARVGALIERSAQVIVPLLLFAGAGLTALAWPVARVAASFGQAASQGLAPIAAALGMFGLGLVGYGMAFTMTRVLFSLREVKQASLLVSAGGVTGVIAMTGAAAWFPDDRRAAALALGYGLSQAVSALLLTLWVRRLTGSPTWRSVGRLGLGAAASALLAGAVMSMVASRFGTDRVGSMIAIAVAAAAGGAVFAASIGALAGVRPLDVLRRREPGVDG